MPRRRIGTRWLARRPSPARPSPRLTGDINDGTPVQVEALIDGAWVNFSLDGDVLYSDAVDLRRGTTSEGQQSDAGQVSFTLKNNADNDYRFSGNNPLSPYYGKFERSTRVRVSVPLGFGKSYRFQGRVTELQEEWDQSGTDGRVMVQAAGILDQLGRGERKAHSALYRDAMRIDPAGLRGLPVAYWPMEDAEGAQSLANEIEPLRPMTFNGDPSLASLQAFPCSDAVPNITGSKFVANIPPYYNRSAHPYSATTVWFLLYAPTTITNNMVLARFSSRNYRYDITQPSANNIRLLIYSEAAVVLYDSGSVPLTIADTPMWIGLWMEDLRDSNQVDFALYSQGTAENASLAGVINNTLVGEDAEPIQRVTINPSGTASDVYIGHVAIFSHGHDGDNAGLAYFPREFVLSGFVGERADVRFARLCTEEGVTHEVIPELTDHPIGNGVKSGVGQKMGKQNVQTIMALLRECETADGGGIYEMTTDFGLGYRTLQDMTSQTAAASLDHGLHELIVQPSPRRDLNRITNDFTATREAGSSAHIEDTTSRMSIHNPPLGVGRFDSTQEYNLYSDTQLGSQANWQVHLGTVSEPRYEKIAVELAHATFTADPSKRTAVLGVTLNDRVDITNTPARLSYDDIPQLAIGVSERIDQFTHSVTWNAVPERPYRIPVLTSDQARIDSSTSSLSLALSEAGTTATVLSTGQRWVYTPAYPNEFPFDINIGGEQMTVTAIYDDAFDDFSDDQTDSWGSADVGGEWTNVGGAAGDYDKTGGFGTHTHTSANVSRNSTLSGVAVTDFDLVVDIQTAALATGGSLYAGPVARFTDFNNCYWARVEFLTTGVIELELISRIAGVQAQIGSTYTSTLTHAADTSYRVRFRITGSTLKARVWLASATEPSAWHVKGADSSLTTGAPGMRTIRDAANTNANAVIRTDNFWASNSGSPQVFTVTRAVNGVVKAHPLNSVVSLWDPKYLALPDPIESSAPVG